MTLFERGSPQMWLYLFMFRPITLQRLNNLDAIDTLICLGGREVTLQTSVRDVPGSIPGSGEYFHACFLVLFLLWLYFFVTRFYLHEILLFLLQR